MSAPVGSGAQAAADLAEALCERHGCTSAGCHALAAEELAAFAAEAVAPPAPTGARAAAEALLKRLWAQGMSLHHIEAALAAHAAQAVAAERERCARACEFFLDADPRTEWDEVANSCYRAAAEAIRARAGAGPGGR